MTLSVRTQGVAYTQGSAATSWVITHNLGTLAPAVDCWVDDGLGNDIKIMPLTVTATDANTVTITFSIARSGNAHVV